MIRNNIDILEYKLPIEIKQHIGKFLRQILIFERLKSIYDIKIKVLTDIGVFYLPKTMTFTWSIDYVKLKQIFFKELTRFEILNEYKWYSLCKLLISGHEWLNGSLYDFIKSFNSTRIILTHDKRIFKFKYWAPNGIVPEIILEKTIKCTLDITSEYFEGRIIEHFEGKLNDIAIFLSRHIQSQDREYMFVHILITALPDGNLKIHIRYGILGT